MSDDVLMTDSHRLFRPAAAVHTIASKIVNSETNFSKVPPIRLLYSVIMSS